MIRVASDEDLAAYVAVWNEVTPDEPADVDRQRERRERDPQRLYLVAEDGGRVVGCGFAGRSDTPGRGFLSPRVAPATRRRGVGSALLRELAAHLAGEGYETASAHVDGNDPGSLAFAERFGFAEVDRQVEQVLTLDGVPPAGVPPPGVRFVSVEERPELLREAYPLAQEGYADLATVDDVVVSIDDWLRDEATLPGGSFVALAGDEIVGYSGLVRIDDTTAEDGLTVVRRSWRRRGLASALKRAELAWAAANGFREVVTWTQRGNDGMRAVNEQLGYVYRSVSITVRRPLPLA
jgi:GNAT superfamily N-acetyltransferase